MSRVRPSKDTLSEMRTDTLDEVSRIRTSEPGQEVDRLLSAPREPPSILTILSSSPVLLALGPVAGPDSPSRGSVGQISDTVPDTGSSAPLVVIELVRLDSPVPEDRVRAETPDTEEPSTGIRSPAPDDIPNS